MAPTRPRFPLPLEALRGGDRGPGARRPAAAPEPPLLRPQAPLDAAARDRARQSVPAGLGLDSDQVRERLVRRLEAQGLRDARVAAAMRAVPRHCFVDSALAQQAYEDTSLPIGWGQTISKPSVVARMLELLIAGQPAGRALRLLEIGSGCGYQAAVMLQLGVSRLVSIERLRPLHELAQARLAACRGDRLRLLHGDGRLGHAPMAPYDGIIAAAGGEALPEAWLAQLAPGGRLVAPVARSPGGPQCLAVVDRMADGRLVEQRHEAVLFVPLESGVA